MIVSECKMSDFWKSYLVPIYKNQDVHKCINDRVIKLISHLM